MLALRAHAVGVYLIYEGVSVILRLVYRPPAPGGRAASPGPRAAPAAAGSRRARWPRSAIVAAVAVFVGTGGTTTALRRTAPATATTSCATGRSTGGAAGDPQLDVGPAAGLVLGRAGAPIADQLADGIRGLLIDTHYADRLPNGKVRTYFGSREELERRAKQDGVSPDAVDAALRIRDRLGFEGEGKRGMYLCHTFCELGATPLESVLDDIRDFLVANPGEVVVVINQDYVTPDGLRRGGEGRRASSEFVYRGPDERHVADAARDDRPRPARRVPGREPRRRGALVPARLQERSPRRRRTTSPRSPS